MWMNRARWIFAGFLLAGGVMAATACRQDPEERDAYDQVRQRQQEVVQQPAFQQMIEAEERRQQEMRE